MDAQSKKEFIGLTDDEINDISICEQISPDRLWHIYIAIEQLLRSKNYGN